MSTISGYVIPSALHDAFNVRLDHAPCVTGLVPIYSGPYAGQFFVNAAIENSCPEWQATWPKAVALAQQHGVSVTPVDVALSDLQNPNAPKLL